MKKFIVMYVAPPGVWDKMGDATPEEKEAGMKPWMEWKEKLGDKIVDFGAPLKNGVNLMSDGNTKPSELGIAGYSMIQAEDIDEAKSLIKDHPHLSWTDGCSIEVLEIAKM